MEKFISDYHIYIVITLLLLIPIIYCYIKRLINNRKYDKIGPGSRIKVRINSLICSCIREAIVQHKTEKNDIIAHLTKKEIEFCKNCNKGSNCWYWVKTFKRKDIIL